MGGKRTPINQLLNEEIEEGESPERFIKRKAGGLFRIQDEDDDDDDDVPPPSPPPHGPAAQQQHPEPDNDQQLNARERPNEPGPSGRGPSQVDEESDRRQEMMRQQRKKHDQKMALQEKFQGHVHLGRFLLAQEYLHDRGIKYGPFSGQPNYFLFTTEEHKKCSRINCI